MQTPNSIQQITAFEESIGIDSNPDSPTYLQPLQDGPLDSKAKSVIPASATKQALTWPIPEPPSYFFRPI